MPPIVVLIILLFLVLMWLTIIAILAMVMYGALAIRVPFVPVAEYVVEALKKEEPLGPGDLFYDLGSGDGRAVLAMAKEYPDAKAIGVEKGPFPYLLSRLSRFFTKRENASFLFKDFSKVSLGGATHVYMYLYPEVVQRLLPKLQAELRPGAKVILCDFPFQARTADRTVPVFKGKKKYTLYFYEF